MATRDETRDLLVELLRSTELPLERLGEWKWMTMLSGEWKRTIPVLFHLDERSLRTTSLLAGDLDEGHRRVYAMLLHYNERPWPVHFALDDEGDILLKGTLPYPAIDEDALDQLLGAILSTCDEVFNRVLRTGFKSYIDAEQRWRQQNDLPPNPVSQAP